MHVYAQGSVYVVCQYLCKSIILLTVIDYCHTSCDLICIWYNYLPWTVYVLMISVHLIVSPVVQLMLQHACDLSFPSSVYLSLPHVFPQEGGLT